MSGEDKVVARECRFAVFCESDHSNDDLHLIKEVLHYEDGTTKPNIRFIKNYKRPFWITKKGARNHEQKKEFERVENLIRYESTQSNLTNAIARSLDIFMRRPTLRKVCDSPYVYGSDILSTALIKKSYQKKYPETNTYYTSAMFDIETDMINGTGDIIMATLSFKDKVVTAVQKSLFEGQADVVARLHAALNRYLGEHVKKRNINWELVLVDNEVEVIKTCFTRAHQWKPDFLAIWNMNFDIPKVAEKLMKAGIDPKYIFSDPSVPDEYKFFRYVEGPSQKVTASGSITPIKPAARWHTVYCPSSFYVIDAMCAYKHIRTGNQEEPSYSLDAILKKHELGGKLKFTEADGYSHGDWHMFMQDRYPIEYTIYNVFDCISMELLDEETLDLALTLPLYSGISDFANFKSQPRRVVDQLHFSYLEKDYVIGSTGENMKIDMDSKTYGLDGWIVTLPAHLLSENGLCLFEDLPYVRSNLRMCVADIDVSASYPNGEACFNVGKATTRKEMCTVTGVSEMKQRMSFINLSGGPTNSVEFATTMFGLPNFDTMLDAFMEQ